MNTISVAAVLLALTLTGCSSSPEVITSSVDPDPAAFCAHLDGVENELQFDLDMDRDQILATTVRAQEIYTEAVPLAPAAIRPSVRAGVASWANLERRFAEAFDAGLSAEEAFQAILVEWESLVDVPANDQVVAFVSTECAPT